MVVGIVLALVRLGGNFGNISISKLHTFSPNHRYDTPHAMCWAASSWTSPAKTKSLTIADMKFNATNLLTMGRNRNDDFTKPCVRDEQKSDWFFLGWIMARQASCHRQGKSLVMFY